MNTQTRREIRFGLIALALSGLLLTLGIGLRGPIDLTNPTSFIQAAASSTYEPAWVFILVGGLLQIYGFFGLYRYLTYRAENLIALLAFVVRIAGLALVIPLATFFAIDGPVIGKLYQQGNQEVLSIVEANFTGLGLAILGVTYVAVVIGWLLFVVAIWRDGRLPKWVVVCFALSLILEAFPVTFVTEWLGVVLLLISTSMIAWKGWQESGAREGTG